MLHRAWQRNGSGGQPDINQHSNLQDGSFHAPTGELVNNR